MITGAYPKKSSSAGVGDDEVKTLNQFLKGLSKDGSLALNFSFDISISKGVYCCNNCKKRNKNTKVLKFTVYQKGELRTLCKLCMIEENKTAIVKVPTSVLKLTVKQVEKLESFAKKWQSYLLVKEGVDIHSTVNLLNIARRIRTNLENNSSELVTKDYEIMVYLVMLKFMLMRRVSTDHMTNNFNTNTLRLLPIACPYTNENLVFKGSEVRDGIKVLEYTSPSIYASKLDLVGYSLLVVRNIG